MNHSTLIIQNSSFACLRASHRQAKGGKEGLGYGK